MNKCFRPLQFFLMIVVSFLILVSCTKDEGNQPPSIPLNFSPANNDTNVSVTPTMIWSACTDPENDSIKYDIYLSTSNPPDLVKSNIYLNKFSSDTLKAYTRYYWKVVAKDHNNNSTTSHIWTFLTGGPIQEPGDLAVLVCDATQSKYFGGAEVFLYKTELSMANDRYRIKYYRKATTDNTDPLNIGAIFYALSDQQYFIFSRRDTGGGNYITGEAQCIVKKGMVTKISVKLQ